MKKKWRKKGYQLLGTLLAMILLGTSAGLEAFASEVSGGDAVYMETDAVSAGDVVSAGDQVSVGDAVSAGDDVSTGDEVSKGNEDTPGKDVISGGEEVAPSENEVSGGDAADPEEKQILGEDEKITEAAWEDIIPEDRTGYESAGDVPTGFWVSGIENQTYMAAAIKPNARVYYGTHLLKENVDYTIRYKNNVNAGVATMTITGKGYYTGSYEQNFTILPADISKAKTQDIAMVQNNHSMKGYKTTVTIVLNGKTVTLKDGVDYEIEYEDNWYMFPGDYQNAVIGKGNFAGSRTSFTQTIMWPGQASINKASVAKIKDQVYTGSPITLTDKDLVVKYSGKTLKQGSDYYVESYSNNTEVGTASVTIKGMGMGFASEKTITFKIVGIPMDKVVVNDFEKSFVYDGNEKLQDKVTLTYSSKNAQNVIEKVTLVPGVDYEITYQNNVNAGTATVIYAGKGRCSGVIKKTYKISPYNLKTDAATQKRIEVQTEDLYYYTKGGVMAKPDIFYHYGSKVKKLEEGKDYTIAYKNQNVITQGMELADNKRPLMTIRGKGNFTGNLVLETPLYYEIAKKDLSKVTVEASDVVYKNAAGNCNPKINVLDENGKKLAAGTDYQKYIIYTYDHDVTVYQMVNKERIAVEKKSGYLVDKADIIPAGTTIRAFINAVNTDKCFYTGSTSFTFRIVTADIARCTVKIEPVDYNPDGMSITKADITVKQGTQIVEEEAYYIASIAFNEKKKQFTVVLVGTGNFGGRKTVTAKIKPLNIKEP